MDHREVAGDDGGHGIERLRELHLIARLVEPPHGGQARHRVPVMRRRIVGIEADRTLNSRSAPGQSQSWVDFTWASEVWASADWPSSMTAVAAQEADLSQTWAGPSTP
jgi:hypothetical protein